jgi:predicted nucleotidyltransferase
LHSCVLRWPSLEEVRAAAEAWARSEAPRHEGLLRLGSFGSYGRGDAGVGSDLDLVAVVEKSSEPFHSRALAWDLLSLPLPAAILVYTSAEWDRLQAEGGRFARALGAETRWLPLPK